MSCVKLITSWVTIEFYYFRDNFLEMVDVLGTLSYSNSFPKFQDACNKFIFCLWFHFSMIILFKFMPQVLNGVEVR